MAEEFGYGLSHLSGVLGGWDIHTDKEDPLANDLNGLSQEARNKIQAIKADFLTRAKNVFSEVVGDVVPINVNYIADLQYQFITLNFASMSEEYQAALHDEMRQKRKLMSSLAGNGFMSVPGFAADPLNELRMETTGKVGAIYREALTQRQANELALFEGKTGALIDLLADLMAARSRFLIVGQQYANSIAKGIKFAVDSTYFDAMTQMKYDELSIKELKVDTQRKNDTLQAYTSVVNIQSRMDATMREYVDYLARDKENAQLADYRQYSDTQKQTVRAGVNAMEWLGRIAAAAEAAANVVVSASVTSFE